MLERWASEVSADGFAENVSSKGVKAWAVRYEEAVRHQDVLVERFRRIVSELASLLRIPRPSRVSTRGYDPPANQSLAATHGHDTPPDLQEIFGMGQFDLPDDPCYTEGYGKDFFAPNRWPERPARMRPAFEAYYRALCSTTEARRIAGSKVSLGRST